MGWFERSGILDDPSGASGVCERIILDLAHPPSYTIARHHRADCAFQTALLFDLYARLIEKESPDRTAIIQNRAGRLFSFPVKRLQDRSPESPAYGLFTWSDRDPGTYWADDNSWCAVLLLKGYDLTGRAEYLESGLLCLEALLRKKPLLIGGTEDAHWGGFYAMAMACGYGATGDPRYLVPCREYVRRQLETRVWSLAQSEPKRAEGLTTPAVALLAASVFWQASRDPDAKRLVDQVGAFLISCQGERGELVDSWGLEQSIPLRDSRPYVDLVYRHNFGTLAFHHAFLATGENCFRKASLKSLRFLGGIQIRSPHPWLDGAWQGAYDPVARRFDGPEHPGGEGGANSLYSGWTHAPIGIAFAFSLSGDGLLPAHGERKEKAIREAARIRRMHDESERQVRTALAAKRKALLESGRAAAGREGNIAFGGNYRLAPAPAGKYVDDTGIKLTDGIVTDYSYEELKCVAWRSDRIEILLDLESPVPLSEARFSCLGGGFAGCDYPNRVELSVSENGSDWLPAGTFTALENRFDRKMPNGQQYSAAWFACRVDLGKPVRRVKLVFDMKEKNMLLCDEIQALGRR